LKPIGIIPNPASGKDIRRLVAYGSVFDNNEKVNIVRRVVLGLDAMGVKDVFFMPDYFGIGVRAIEDLEVSLKANFLDMKIDNTPDDSTRAADILDQGLLTGSLRDNNPVLFIEHKVLYQMPGPVPEEE